ncbi:MAG: class I tRNA ligase family protein [Candidatus Bathyarchaeota archaeon]|nr:class I tRNA ligase family protein [Candidatus Bathyarchaeota archaeon]
MPREDKQVKMYTCGPSTYQPAHIGNYRTFLYEDILQRYIEYLGYKVIRLMTLTDVEDKAVEQAKKENLTLEQLTAKNEATFFLDFNLLKNKEPDLAIRASSAIDQAVKLIQQLLQKGIAYTHTYRGTENVYFDPLKFKDFGKLAHLDMTKWPKKKRRFHKDTYPGTPWTRGDFVLWHGCKPNDACYESPLGRGRPSWNVQDPAIVTKHLGFQIDLACGGIDNLVRHHDYNLAVVEAVSGLQFSKFWLHGGHLLVDGKKMSKSKGNVLYLKDLLDKGFSGQQIRFFLIYAPYREKLDFTLDGLVQTSQKLDALKEMIIQIQTENSQTSNPQTIELPQKIRVVFEEKMNENLDVRGAFDGVYDVVMRLHLMRDSLSIEEVSATVNNLQRVDSVLQCLF